MKYYDLLFEKPLLLSILALIIVYLTGIDIFQELIIFAIIGIFYTFKNKEVMSKEFKLKFALYYAAVSTVGLLIILVCRMFNPWGAMEIIYSLPLIVLQIFLRPIKRFIGSYVVLWISNRLALLLLEISELKNWFKYTVRPFVIIVEKPVCLIIIAVLIMLFNFSYRSVSYENDDFKLAGKLKNNDDIVSIIPLDNGNVFILKHEGYDTECNIFNFKTGQFSPNLVLKQNYESSGNPKAVKLNNGKVLIVGSSPDFAPKTQVNYGELYDPTTNKLSFTGRNLYPTYGFSLIKLQNGKILIAGGAGQDKKAQIFDPETNKFSMTGSLKEGRIDPTLLLLKNGKVLVLGTGLFHSKTRELYDPAKGTFNFVSDLPLKTGCPDKILTLKDGSYLMYSTSFENYQKKKMVFYNPYENKSEEYFLPELNEIENFEMSMLQDGRILFTGGFKKGPGNLTSAFIFDPYTRKCTKINHGMNIPRSYHFSVNLQDGRILILGGVNSDSLGIEQSEIFVLHH